MILLFFVIFLLFVYPILFTFLAKQEKMEHPEVTLKELQDMIRNTTLDNKLIMLELYQMEKKCIEKLQHYKRSDKRKTL